MTEIIEQKKEIAALPALSIQIIGEVKGSNLVEYKETALKFIESINTDLKTDDDFTAASENIKFCNDAEKELQLVKTKALSETADIEALFKTVDELTVSMRTKRLALNKLVTAQKEAIRTKVVNDAVKALDSHVATIYEDIKPLSFPHLGADFNKAIKGKSAIKSIKASVAVELKTATDKADGYHEHIKANLVDLNELAGEYKFLFNDLNQIILNEFDHFRLIVTTRVKEYDDAEKIRLDKIREDAEVEAKKKLADEAAQKLIDDAIVEPVEELPVESEPEEVVQAENIEAPTRHVSSGRGFRTGPGPPLDATEQPKQEMEPNADAIEANKAAVDKAIIAAFVAFGVPVGIASMMVAPMAKGQIPKVQINY